MTHPALQAAADGCARLAQAASTVGSPDPIAAIKQIDYDPQAVDGYVQQLRAAATDLDKAIEEHEKALAEHEASGDGSASDSANAALTEELAALRDERKQLETLVTEVEQVAKRMDELARAASDQILKIAAQADPAVSMVLDGSWLDDVTGEGAQAEETVHRAVADIIKVCQATQDQVSELRSELNAALDAAESGGGGTSGEAGTSDGGTSQQGPSDGGAAQGG
ncbi:hypothetical protein ALI22I_37715 [Saccharothrix sp. ALI-22-I]|uniref:hypothetical protein n=1 Tax=Saccharothrix sp. ALI-22-I TaxID=1933778 RepID=UPI00097C8AB7|nr:hypothetical protein [Saccharothrix sp. ALI-22-I]ONI81927.1 hypothetical protein ALI22I_37715 [Saccharothrix sp. ALI-22-I]